MSNTVLSPKVSIEDGAVVVDSAGVGGAVVVVGTAKSLPSTESLQSVVGALVVVGIKHSSEESAAES
jgi:hypothetical protein